MNTRNAVVFTGKNYERVIKKMPELNGVYFIVGMKGEDRKPLTMSRVRKYGIKKKFEKGVVMGLHKVDRKSHLEQLLAENGFDKIIVEWEV